MTRTIRLNGDFVRRPVERDDEYYIKIGKQADALRKLNASVKREFTQKLSNCQICGAGGRITGHHYLGYDNPYDVWWICPRCNSLLPFHDGSLSLDEATIYVNNRRVYNDYYKIRDTDDIGGMLEMLSTKYIDWGLVRLRDKEQSGEVKSAILIYDTTRLESVVVIGYHITGGRGVFMVHESNVARNDVDLLVNRMKARYTKLDFVIVSYTKDEVIKSTYDIWKNQKKTGELLLSEVG